MPTGDTVQVIKRLGTLALACLLAGCGGPAPAPKPTAAPLTGLDSVDVCTLLERTDFSEDLTGPSGPLGEPQSCEWRTSDTTVRLKIEHRSLEQVERYDRRTEDLVLEGRRAWWGVEREGNSSTAVVVTELSPDDVLTMRAERSPAGYGVATVARDLTTAALRRLGS
jgi:hypothetical protein